MVSRSEAELIIGGRRVRGMGGLRKLLLLVGLMLLGPAQAQQQTSASGRRYFFITKFTFYSSNDDS